VFIEELGLEHRDAGGEPLEVAGADGVVFVSDRRAEQP
jgi:hypothetical protein